MKSCLFIFLLFPICLAAQIGNTIDLTKKLDFNIEAENIYVEGYDGEEILFEEEGIYSNISNFKNKTITITQRTTRTIIENIPSEVKQFKFKIPNKSTIRVRARDWKNQSIEIANFEGKIEIDGGVEKVNLTDITGPVQATTYGPIQVVFSKFNTAKSSSIVSTIGDVQVYIPDTTNAYVSMYASKIKTRLPIAHKGRKKPKRSLEGTLNEGGQLLEIASVDGKAELLSK